jgi:HTH-type transcriptional regulator/antitoxin HipB
MDYPLRFVDQLRPHLKALRKKRGLTQAQAGALVGVSQARIAEIEANPGAVNFEQLMRLLSALGGSFAVREDAPSTPVLHVVDEPAQASGTLPDTDVKLPQGPGRWAVRRMNDQSVLVSLVVQDAAGAVPARSAGPGELLRALQALNPDKDVKPTSRRNFVVRTREDAW